jgi:hypothetical protein
MKTIIAFIFLSLLFSCNSNSIIEKSKQVKFSISITHLIYLVNQEKHFLVTQDSILVDSSYKAPLNEKAKEKLTFLLSSFSLDSMKKDYWNSNVDDGADYIFEITTPKQSKKITVHYEKVQELAELTKEINLLLPSQLRIGYDETYFNKYK